MEEGQPWMHLFGDGYVDCGKNEFVPEDSEFYGISGMKRFETNSEYY
jgi:hypothetical protein